MYTRPNLAHPLQPESFLAAPLPSPPFPYSKPSLLTARRIGHAGRYLTPTLAQLAADVRALNCNPEDKSHQKNNQCILDQTLPILFN
jgi:hypothetical protein